jgi:hypothetical protein
MNTGTLSGRDVLDLGKIESGALVALSDGSTAIVVDVEGKRLSHLGTTRGSVLIRRDGGAEAVRVDSSDITAVLLPPDDSRDPSANGN